MADKKVREPHVINWGVWTMAVLAAAALATTTGWAVYNSVSKPISAATDAQLTSLQNKVKDCQNSLLAQIGEGQAPSTVGIGAVNPNLTEDFKEKIRQFVETGPVCSTCPTWLQKYLDECNAMLNQAKNPQAATQPSGETTAQVPTQIASKPTTNQPTSTCPEGYVVKAINNYPEPIDDAEALQVFQKMGFSGDARCFRCSDICIPQGTNINDYLSKMTANGQPIKILNNKDEFIALVNENPSLAAESSIVKPSIKNNCEGPISSDYKNLIVDGQPVKIAATNNRCAAYWAKQGQQAAQPTQPTQIAPGVTQNPDGSTTMGPSDLGPLGTAQPSEEGTTAGQNTTLQNFEKCMNEKIYAHYGIDISTADYDNRLEALNITQKFHDLENAYLNRRSLSEEKLQSALNTCNEIYEAVVKQSTSGETGGAAGAGGTASLSPEIKNLQTQIVGCTQEVRGKIGQIKSIEKRQVFLTTLETITSIYHSTAPSLTTLQGVREQCATLKNQVNQELEKQKGGGILGGISELGRDIYDGAAGAAEGAADLINRGLEYFGL